MAETLRLLTRGETALLEPIFGNTLHYYQQQIRRNDQRWGGPNNSITPANVPSMAISLWSLDYSRARPEDKWVFIHEMTHVWQNYHGENNVINAFWIWAHYSDYDDAYYYDLTTHGIFTDYNMEQQASIVADYWYVRNGLSPDYNRNRSRAQIGDYLPPVLQIHASGPPRYFKRDPDKEIGFKM